MGEFDLLREAFVRRRRRSLAPSLTLDPFPELLDRLGNGGMGRLLLLGGEEDGVGGPTPSTPGPAPTPPAEASPTDEPTANPPAPAEPSTTPTTVAPATPATPRSAPTTVTPDDLHAPALLGLGDPLTDFRINAADYSFAARGLGWAFDQIPNRYLSILGQLALAYPLFEGRQYLHEGGHYRARTFFGGHPWIDFPLFGRPQTNDTVPLTGRADAITTGAGMTQNQLNAMQLYSDWARNGVARPFESLAYLMANTDVWTYSLYRGLVMPPTALDDPVSYIRTLDQLNDPKAPFNDPTNKDAYDPDARLHHKMSQKELVAIALPAWALSGGTLSSGYGLIRYLLNKGDSRIPLASSQVGGLRFTWPDFHVLLGGSGPIVGAQTMLFPRPDLPIEAQLDVQPLKAAAGVSAQLFDRKLPGASAISWLKDWRLNPFLAVSAGSGRAGVRLGTDLVVPVGPLLLNLTAGYDSSGFLLHDVLSEKDLIFSARLGYRRGF
jgi:hypothetical protein